MPADYRRFTSGALPVIRNSIVWLGCDRRNLREDGVDIDRLTTFGALTQIALRIERESFSASALLTS